MRSKIVSKGSSLVLRAAIDTVFGETDRGVASLRRCASCGSMRRDIDDEGRCRPCGKVYTALIGGRGRERRPAVKGTGWPPSPT